MVKLSKKASDVTVIKSSSSSSSSSLKPGSDEVKKYIAKAKEEFYEVSSSLIITIILLILLSKKYFEQTSEDILRIKATTIGHTSDTIGEQRNFMNKSFKDKISQFEKISEKAKDTEIEFVNILKTLKQSEKVINEMKEKENSLENFVTNLEKELLHDLKKYKSSP